MASPLRTSVMLACCTRMTSELRFRFCQKSGINELFSPSSVTQFVYRIFLQMCYCSDQMKIFTRKVTSSGSEYVIDGQVRLILSWHTHGHHFNLNECISSLQTVTPAQYTQAMEDMKIFIKAKNFLVYQGQVSHLSSRISSLNERFSFTL